jgi:hypothetical protein
MMMRTNALAGLLSKSASADSLRRMVLSQVLRRRRREPLVRELLAEAHARIRVLEEALDRVKNAV